MRDASDVTVAERPFKNPDYTKTMKHPYEINGKVKISEQWYPITRVSITHPPIQIQTKDGLNWPSEQYIQDYTPPPEPEDPTVHVCTGKEAEYYGLTYNTPILYWYCVDRYWSKRDYCNLVKGDHWRKMPPPPQTP